MAAQSQYLLTYKDYSKEDSSVGYTGLQLDGDNYDAQIILAHNLRTATDGITIGTRIAEKVISETHTSSGAAPTDKNAQRERKWLIRYQDVTQYYDFPSTEFPNPGYGKNFTLDVPTADLSLLPAAQTDTVDASAAGLHANLTAYITAFNAFQRSPHNGAVALREFVAVGRSL